MIDRCCCAIPTAVAQPLPLLPGPAAAAKYLLPNPCCCCCCQTLLLLLLQAKQDSNLLQLIDDVYEACTQQISPELESAVENDDDQTLNSLCEQLSAYCEVVDAGFSKLAVKQQTQIWLQVMVDDDFDLRLSAEIEFVACTAKALAAAAAPTCQTITSKTIAERLGESVCCCFEYQLLVFCEVVDAGFSKSAVKQQTQIWLRIGVCDNLDCEN